MLYSSATTFIISLRNSFALSAWTISGVPQNGHFTLSGRFSRASHLSLSRMAWARHWPTELLDGGSSERCIPMHTRLKTSMIRVM